MKVKITITRYLQSRVFKILIKEKGSGKKSEVGKRKRWNEMLVARL